MSLRELMTGRVRPGGAVTVAVVAVLGAAGPMMVVGGPDVSLVASAQLSEGENGGGQPDSPSSPPDEQDPSGEGSTEPDSEDTPDAPKPPSDGEPSDQDEPPEGNESAEVSIASPRPGEVISDPRPRFSGNAGEAGEGPVSVEVYSGEAPEGVPIQRLEAPTSGEEWNVQSMVPLLDGVYTAQAERRGSADSAPVTFTVAADSPAPAVAAAPPLRFEDFDSDPGWEGVGNRNRPQSCPVTDQDFGFSPTSRAEDRSGEVGGKVWGSLTPAHYGKVLPQALGLDEPISASGTLVVDAGSTFDHGKGLLAGGLLFGFFNRRSQDWRTPDSLVMRLEEGEGQGNILVGPEYGTSDYRSAGRRLLDAGRGGNAHLTLDRRYHFDLGYDPSGAGGRGQMTLEIAGVGTATLDLQEGHRADGAELDRFGILSRQVGGNEISAHFDDLVVNRVTEEIGTEAPADWAGEGNDSTFSDCQVDDRHDFGYDRDSKDGRLGGLLWRTESDRPDLYAHYADRVGELSLDGPLHAEGKVDLERGSSDSAVLLGFFDSRVRDMGDLSAGDNIPPGFLGVGLDGPSREGFLLRPVARAGADQSTERRAERGPRIVPRSGWRDFEIDYVPTPDGGGTLTSTLDGQSVTIPISPEDRAGLDLDRFGLHSVMRGGHPQVVYFDDLSYSATTAVAEPPPGPSPGDPPADPREEDAEGGERSGGGKNSGGSGGSGGGGSSGGGGGSSDAAPPPLLQPAPAVPVARQALPRPRFRILHRSGRLAMTLLNRPRDARAVISLYRGGRRVRRLSSVRRVVRARVPRFDRIVVAYITAGGRSPNAVRRR